MTDARLSPPFDDPALRAILDAGLLELSLDDPRLAPALLRYLALLDKWSKAYNLTAIRDPQQMIVRLLLDSLSIVPYIQGPRVADVGTGAGLPGIPLALALPGCRFSLLDSNRKKTRFVTQAVAELGLANVEVRQARAESYRPGQRFDSVVTRAFATLAATVQVAGHLCRSGGCLLIMKGRYPSAELEELPAGCRLLGVERLVVPGLGAERYLVRLEPQPAA